MRTLRSLRSAGRMLALSVGGVWMSNCSDLPTDVQRTKVLVRPTAPKSFEALAVTAPRVLDAGAYHTCAIKSDSTVVCWGSNGYGESSVPAGLASVSQIAAGGYHNCALKSDGTVTCWGLNHVGQGSVPAGLSSVISISAGSFHNCALKSDSTVVCWGANGDGESNVPAGLS